MGMAAATMLATVDSELGTDDEPSRHDDSDFADDSGDYEIVSYLVLGITHPTSVVHYLLLRGRFERRIESKDGRIHDTNSRCHRVWDGIPRNRGYIT
jgi:hypothetical protein